MHTIRTNSTNLTPITLFVIVIHVLVIFWVIFNPSSPFIPRKIERLVVKTVHLTPTVIPKTSPKQEIKESPPPIAISIPEPTPFPETLIQKTETVVKKVEETPKPQSEPVKKMETPKPVISKKPISKPKPNTTEKMPKKKAEPIKKNETVKKATVKKDPSPKTTSKQTEKKSTQSTPEKPQVDPKVEAAKAKAQQELELKQKKLLAAAQESIAKIDQGRAKISSAKSTLNNMNIAPVAISSLQIDALPVNSSVSLTVGEKSYRDEIASRLKLLLKLPDHGDVQLKLTLDRTGKVSKVSIVKSASSENRKYIEKTLPGLKFPAFGSHFENSAEYTFIIQLSNEL